MQKRKILGSVQSKDVINRDSHSEVYLTPWSELVGIYYGLQDEEPFTFIMIGEKSVVFPKDSIEAELARRQLNRDLLKRKIAVLRTDPDTGHLFVRVVEK
jgi:hypothetical protein